MITYVNISMFNLKLWEKQAQSDLWAATIYKLMHQMKTILTELPIYGYWPGSVLCM